MNFKMKPAKEKKSKGYGKKIIAQITGIFMPIINTMTAASIIKGGAMILLSTGTVAADNGIYMLLMGCSDGFFYFLPFFLAYTASKQWNTDPFISMLIPVTMLFPDIVAVIENGGKMKLFGISVPNTVYHSSVLPVILAIALLIPIERLCDKFIHDAVRGFLKPIICCVIVLPLTFIVLGPIGTYIGDFLTMIFSYIYNFNPILAGAFMGFVIQPMVSVGAHWSIVPVCINNVQTLGYDMIMPLVGAAVYAQSAVALCIGLMYEKTEANKEKRRVAFQASFAAFLGVTEPALYGVNLAVGRGMLTACVSAAIGGAMVGAAGTHCNSFAFPSFLTCVVYYGNGFGVFLLSMVAGFVIATVLMLLQRKKIKEILKNQTK